MVSYEFSVKHLVENERISEKAIDEIKNWCKIQNNVPDLSEQQVALFLIACDNILEDTKKCITCFYLVRVNAAELFDNRDVTTPALQKQLNVLNFCILRERTDDNHAVILNTIADPSASNYQMDKQMTLMLMTFEASQYRHPPEGIVLLYDMNNFGLGHVFKTKVNIIRKILHYIQDAMPLKIKAIHVLNSNWYCDKILAIVKPFMYKELFNKINFHCPDANMEEFYEKHVPKSIMPSDYGGTGPTIKELHLETSQTLADLTHHFTEEINQRKSLKK